MIAYKGFNNDLTCTMGKGRFRYEVGRSYQESEANCAQTGFHCVEEPIEVLNWYRYGRYCIVKAEGDIHEDGNERISCTELTVLRELTLIELGMLECGWMQKRPNRKYSSFVEQEKGYAWKKDQIVIVRGKNPKAAGQLGTTLFLVKEEKTSKTIAEIGVYQIDGKHFKPDVYYRADGKRCRS